MKTICQTCFAALAVLALPALAQTNKPAADPDQIDFAQIAGQRHYDHPYRPQFHYTPLSGHIGDATGMFRYQGAYHLFHMFDPFSRLKRDNKNWGHAVSTDLLHWEQREPILNTVLDNRPGSGGGIVDWNNSSGLRTGPEKTLLVFYTDYQRGTCLTFSRDAGRTWQRHARNPILGGVAEIRDPRVFWYAAGQAWRMVRYEKKGMAFYSSTNLLDWTFQSRNEGFYECPDFFELPVDGNDALRKWVLVDGDGSYFIGSYDGAKFTPETERLHGDFGKGLYATQSWAEHCDETGARIQMAFLKAPPRKELIWCQQMSFPCELTLRTTPAGVRLCRQPITMIRNLRHDSREWSDVKLSPGENPLADVCGDTFEIRATLNVGAAESFAFDLRGEKLVWTAADNTLTFGKKQATVPRVNGRVTLTILVDRSSVEVFANLGETSINTTVFFADPKNERLGLSCTGGALQVERLEVHRLESIWLAHDHALGHERAKR